MRKRGDAITPSDYTVPSGGRKRSTRRARSVKLRTNGKHKIDAASTISAPVGGLGRILRPQALFRWLGPQLANITPTYIEQTMLGAMAGNTTQAWSLFDVMLKSWPELLACYQELIESVIRKKLVYEPYCEEDEKPTPSALEKQKVVATALRRMQPDPTRDDSDLEGTIRDVLDAWFRGMAVSEVIWQTVDDAQVGTITAPKSTFPVDVTNYAYAADGSLGIRINKTSDSGIWPYSSTALNPQPNQLAPFSNYPNKFLIAMHKASGGSPLGGALLRPLAWWWCAANFSSDWLLNLAQLFGLPFRWVTYDTSATSDTIAAIDQMLQNMGSNGWARFPVGTTMEMLQTGKEGSDHSPQGELLDRADRYARSLILGQTMTGNHGTTGKGGGQAFGKVEEEVKSDRVDAAGKFAVQVINQQLVPSILMLNFGDTDEMPTLKFLEDEVADLTEAQRDKTLADAGLEIGVDYLRKKYDIPEPADGEDVIGGAKPAPSFGGFGNQNFGNQDPNAPDPENPTETKDPNEESDIGAGDMPGHDFHGNQWIQGDSISQSGARAEQLVEDHRARYRHALSQLPDGTTIGKHTKQTIGSDVLWIHKNGKSGTPNVMVEEGQKAVDKALTKHGIAIPQNYFAAAMKSSDQTGHPFRGNQYVKSQMVSVPRGGSSMSRDRAQGQVVHETPNFVHVQFDREEGMKKELESARSEEQRAALLKMHDRERNSGVFQRFHTEKHLKSNVIPISKPFPSLLPSEENKRRLMRNAGLQTKFIQLYTTEDDAVFSKELAKLAEELCQQEQK